MKLKSLVGALVASTLFSLPSHADKLYVGQLTYHFDKEDTQVTNESHELLIYQHDSGWVGGYFKNSYDKDTFLVGKSFTLLKNDTFDVGVKAGLVKGYEDHFDYPIFGVVYAEVGNFSFNFLPTQFVGVGLKFDI